MCGQWRELPEDELSTENWKKIFEDLRKNGIENIHFTGGEPLMRPDLIELVSYCHKRGFVAGLTTNGTLLERDILERLIRAGLRSIAISVDALDDEYERIRGVSNSFVRLKDAVFFISEMKRREGLDAYINYTLMNHNIDEFKKVKELADAAGLPVGICLLDKSSSIFRLDDNKKKFWIDKAEDITRMESLLAFLKSELIKRPRSFILNYPAIDFIRDYFKDPHQAQIPCSISQDRIFIDPYGNLLGGCLSMGNFGNVKETPFRQLCKEPRYRLSKRNMFYKRCPGCSCGYLFNIRHMPGLVFGDLGERIKYLLRGKK